MSMVIDVEAAKAYAFPKRTVTVDRRQLVSFADAIGEHDPVYRDADAARAAGHPDLPIPPTFLFSLELETYGLGYLPDMGIDLQHVLHGEQEFRYDALAFAGDELTIDLAVVDAYTRKGGALGFLVKSAAVHRGEEPIATTRQVVLVQAPEETA